MKFKLRLIRNTLRRREYRLAWRVIKMFLRGLVPICRRCGHVGWHEGSAYCWPCQRENLFAMLSETREEYEKYCKCENSGK